MEKNTYKQGCRDAIRSLSKALDESIKSNGMETYEQVLAIVSDAVFSTHREALEAEYPEKDNASLTI